MNQEQVWDKIAEKWSEYRKNAPFDVAEFLKYRKGKVLDLGCGSGRNIIPNPNVEYYGVDFSSEMLKFAEKNAKKKKANAAFFKSQLYELPFKANFFNTAIFISTLHCIPEPEDRKNALKELYRVLKKGGEAMITVWNKEQNPIAQKLGAKEGFINWKKEGYNFQRYYYFYEEDELRKLLKSVGFKILNKTNEGKHSIKNIIFYVKK